MIAGQIQEITGKKVTMESFKVAPPLNLEIKNLNIEGLARIENVFISPSIPSLLIGRLALNSIKVNKPEFTFERKPQEAIEESEAGTNTASAKTKKGPPPHIIFKRLNVKGGKINFSDHTLEPPGIRVTVKDINLNLTNMYSFPSAAVTSFNLSGKIPWKEGAKDGEISLEGWINLHKKDMQAILKVESIDGVYLYPYYSKWVDLDKARIEQANLSFSSNISGLNNNVTADCHLELTDIVRKPLAQGESDEKAARIADQVMDIFRTLNQGKVVLDFTIRTKMDRPQFGFGNIKMAVEDKLARARNGNGITVENLLLLPARLLIGTVRSTTDFSKAIIDGTFAVGNEFKKAFQDTFKKEPEENKN